jgi:hypothetical protein
MPIAIGARCGDAFAAHPASKLAASPPVKKIVARFMAARFYLLNRIH